MMIWSAKGFILSLREYFELDQEQSQAMKHAIEGPASQKEV